MISATTDQSLPVLCSFGSSLDQLRRINITVPITIAGGGEKRVDPVDWDEVHRRVQAVFGEAAGRVRRGWANSPIRSHAGRASGRSFPLFSFRTFALAEGAELDPVLVGLIFEPAQGADSIVIRGEIGGEESGRVDFEIPERVVPNRRGDLLPAALSMAAKLGEQSELIVKTVLDRHPPPSY